MAEIELADDERIAVQCSVCGGWLVADESVARRMGPTCAGKHRGSRPPKGMEPLFPMEVS